MSRRNNCNFLRAFLSCVVFSFFFLSRVVDEIIAMPLFQATSPALKSCWLCHRKLCPKKLLVVPQKFVPEKVLAVPQKLTDYEKVVITTILASPVSVGFKTKPTGKKCSDLISIVKLVQGKKIMNMMEVSARGVFRTVFVQIGK